MLRRGARLFSTERAITEALARAAAAVKKADPAASIVQSHDAADTASGSEQLQGVRTPGPKMVLRFECTHSKCDHEDQRLTTKIISKRSYEQGTTTLLTTVPCVPFAVAPSRTQSTTQPSLDCARFGPRAMQLQPSAPHCGSLGLVWRSR